MFEFLKVECRTNNLWTVFIFIKQLLKHKVSNFENLFTASFKSFMVLTFFNLNVHKLDMFNFLNKKQI